MTGNSLWVDEARGLVYFTGLWDTPLEQHLYVTSVSHPALIQRLTKPGFSHQVALNEVRIFSLNTHDVEEKKSIKVCAWYMNSGSM